MAYQRGLFSPPFKTDIGGINVFTASGLGFLAPAVLQNLRRPLAISRINSCSNPENNTFLLSIESRAKSLFMAVFAPLPDFSLDIFRLWPVGAMVMILCWQGNGDEIWEIRIYD